MKIVTYVTIVLSLITLFNGCSAILTPEKIKEIKQSCIEKGDSFLYVSGECLEYVKLNNKKEDEVNVFLHGSYSKGGNPLPNYYNNKVEILKNSNIPTYIIALPGYNKSTSNQFGRMIQSSSGYIAAERRYIDFVKKVLETIKMKENAKELNVIGHSAGATLATNISALYPKLIDKVIVYEGNYDMEYYTFIRGWNLKYNATTAMRNINGIDKSTKFFILYGKLSDKKKPLESIRFIEALKNKNIDVESKEYDYLGHSTTEVVFYDIVEYLKKQ